MVERSEDEPASTSNRTISELTSEREMLTTRTFDAPSQLVFEAWTTRKLFRQWWVPKSSGATLLSCEQDLRVDSSYRLVCEHPKATAPARSMGWGSTPMIGFDATAVRTEYGLANNEIPVMLLAVGPMREGNWPSKPRLPVLDVLSFR
jgi:hypothetical protein